TRLTTRLWRAVMGEIPFDTLIGRTITGIDGEVGGYSLTFTCEDGSRFCMYHSQDCCENVYIEDICGDMRDLIGSPVIMAEAVTSTDDPEDTKVDTKYRDSFTWTFYKLATINGAVTIRWYGQSNGYYS